MNDDDSPAELVILAVKIFPASEAETGLDKIKVAHLPPEPTTSTEALGKTTLLELKPSRPNLTRLREADLSKLDPGE